MLVLVCTDLFVGEVSFTVGIYFVGNLSNFLVPFLVEFLSLPVLLYWVLKRLERVYHQNREKCLNLVLLSFLPCFLTAPPTRLYQRVKILLDDPQRPSCMAGDGRDLGLFCKHFPFISIELPPIFRLKRSHRGPDWLVSW